jgi:aldose 1-epimerase
VPVGIAAGDTRVLVDPEAGGRAVSWQVGDLELLGRGDGPVARTAVGWGMFVMAPWAGRLRDNTLRYGGGSYPMPVDGSGWALHGTVLGRAWAVDDAQPDRVELSVPLQPPWPWPGTVRATWAVEPGRLEAELVVEAHEAAFPASVGWHPWFRRTLARGGAVQVDVPGTTMIERGPDHLPTGRVLDPRPPGPYDDAFPLPAGTTTLVWPGALRLECRSDCRYAVLYDEPVGAVCLEPQTAPPDGLNTSPDLVFPGRPLVARAAWSWGAPG